MTRGCERSVTASISRFPRKATGQQSQNAGRNSWRAHTGVITGLRAESDLSPYARGSARANRNPTRVNRAPERSIETISNAERGFQIKEVTLTAEQADLCRTVLCQNLMKVSRLLATGKDGSGNKLTRHSRRELMGYSSRLQLTLMALGMTSAELEGIVKSFGTDPL